MSISSKYLFSIILLGIIGNVLAGSERPNFLTSTRCFDAANGDTIPYGWKTFSSNKLGITFQYPPNWMTTRELVPGINLNGDTTKFELFFHDEVSQNSFSITYHLAPNGLLLYNYALSQFHSSQGWYKTNAQLLEIAGDGAIMASATITENAKGNPLESPRRIIIVDFLDKNRTGNFQFQLQVSSNDSDMVTESFLHMLTSLSFIQ